MDVDMVPRPDLNNWLNSPNYGDRFTLVDKCSTICSTIQLLPVCKTNQQANNATYGWRIH